ncbi:hypothetical protein [Halostella litorea]|uniref:hypothetical protein n=1 Tax=Halostella litorea TaxID=2528831 RepID=UPI001092B537|nr:hypothetical protein [Halostella litorea]
MPPTRRGFGAAATAAAVAGLSGCLDRAIRLIPGQGNDFPDEPPAAAEETAKAYLRALGNGRYEAACRDRCLLRVEDGETQLSANSMDDADLRQWAEEARSFYGSAGWRVSSVAVVDSEKMNGSALAAADFPMGYHLTLEWEGTGNVANPTTTSVVKDDGDWYVLTATF